MTRRRRYGWWAALAVVILMAGVVVFLDRRQPGDRSGAPASDSSLLALTWGPSLCSVDSSVRGCRTGNVSRKGQTFLLHGLWPQPESAQYCGVSKDRSSAPELPADIRARLGAVMSDASVLAPHEWLAHGSCSGVSPAEYFSVAVTLAAQATAVLDPAVRAQQGHRLSVNALRELFDGRFGPGAGSRLSLTCRRAEGRGDVVYEVRLSLPSVVSLRAAGESLLLGEQLAKAPAVPAGCRQAQVL